ncbi:unnamed protein product [Peniophora sp. CBMAI 1063]|nr:unnamed protein product [Peniophora sp. CBMAI 1063]
MSVLACLRRPPQFTRAWTVARTYAKKVEAAAPPRKVVIPQVPEGALSTCRPNTPLVGVNYLKDQEEVLALPDEEYPPWLWDLLKPKQLPDDGPDTIRVFTCHGGGYSTL